MLTDESIADSIADSIANAFENAIPPTTEFLDAEMGIQSSDSASTYFDTLPYFDEYEFEPVPLHETLDYFIFGDEVIDIEKKSSNTRLVPLHETLDYFIFGDEVTDIENKSSKTKLVI